MYIVRSVRLFNRSILGGDVTEAPSQPLELEAKVATPIPPGKRGHLQITAGPHRNQTLVARPTTRTRVTIANETPKLTELPVLNIPRGLKVNTKVLVHAIPGEGSLQIVR